MRKLCMIAVFVFLGILIYSNTFQNSFHLDDRTSIIENHSIKDLGRIDKIWEFSPTNFVAYLSLAFNYYLGRLNVLGYHIFNLIIHIFSAVMVFWFSLITFSTPGMENDRIKRHSMQFSFFAGLIFLTHPVQTEGVTYIVQRTASIAALFYIGSLCLYAKSRLLRESGNRYSSLYYTGSLVTMILSMFSKEISITLPLMILLYEYCFFKDKKGISWRYILPFFLGILIIPSTMLFTKTLWRLRKEGMHISAIHYFFTQARVKITYMRLLLIPVNQNLDYDYPIYKTFFNLPVIAGFIASGAIIITAFKIFRKYKLIAFGIFWFYITLLAESSIIPIRDVIFEHRLYLPMAGYSFFLAGVIYMFFDKKKEVLISVLTIIIIIYSVMTYERNFVWKDEITLWNDVICKSPNKARPYNDRGYAYAAKGNLDQAILDFSKAIQIDSNCFDFYYNRGNACLNKGNFDQAISDFSKAIQINPNFFSAYFNRGSAYLNKGNLDQAILDFDKAIQVNPEHALVYINRGNAYFKKGNLDQAMSDYNKAIQIEPNFSFAHFNLGYVYAAKGSLDQAILAFSKAIQINPGYAEAYYNRGNAYFNKGNLGQAILDYSKAIQINSNHVESYYNRAVTYFLVNEYNKSWEDIQKAKEMGYKIDPEFFKEILIRDRHHLFKEK